MFEGLFPNLEAVILTLGPPGIFLAMFIETIFPPIPSEVVMPFAGYIAFIGGRGLVGLVNMVLAGTAGTTLGAVVIYFIALKGGRRLVLRYGKRVGFDEKKIELAEGWFKKYGDYAVFFGRMAPGVRELISIPAGLVKMHFWRFLVFTFSGSFIWSAFLGSIGFFLADAWRSLNLESVVSIMAAIILLSIAGYFAFKYFLKRRRS